MIYTVPYKYIHGQYKLSKIIPLVDTTLFLLRDANINLSISILAIMTISHFQGNNISY